MLKNNINDDSIFFLLMLVLIAGLDLILILIFINN